MNNGQNFLEPVMDQVDCGSCYVVSTMRMLSARNKIRLQEPDALPFSISFPLYCSEYNQGCDGGYAFLTSKWSEGVRNHEGAPEWPSRRQLGAEERPHVLPGGHLREYSGRSPPGMGARRSCRASCRVRRGSRP